jgi:PAS domain S-box-containing protein
MLLVEIAADISKALEWYENAATDDTAQENSLRYVAMLESASDAIVTTSPSGSVCSWNSAAERMFDYSSAETIGHDIRMLDVQDLVGEEAEIVARIAEGEQPVNFETRCSRRGGAQFDASVIISPLFWHSQNRAGLTRIIRDITDHKRTQEELNEARLRLTTVVDNLLEGLIVFDSATNLLTCNRAALEMFGFTDQQDSTPTRETFRAVFETTSLDGLPLSIEDQPLERALCGESIRNIEVRVRRVGTDWKRIFAYSGSTVRLSSGSTLASVTIADITERQRAISALRASEAQLMNAQRIAKIGSWEWDIVNNKLHCSDELCLLFGLDRESFGGTYEDFVRLVHPLDREAMESTKRATLAGTAPFNIEHRLVLPDGSEKYVYQCGDLVRGENHEPLFISGTAQDVSERRLAAAKLRDANASLEARVLDRTRELAAAKESAESADRLKSDFLATMSHELRTPLNSIIGFTSLMLQRLGGPLTLEQNKQLGMVRTSARHLLALINDVLDISKIEAGQLELRVEAFDLITSLETVVASVRPFAEKKKLQLRLISEPGLGSLVSDQVRVEQVLLNLLNNAIKFTERGTVTLSVTRQNPADLRQPSQLVPSLVLRVEDSGIGITQSDMVSLFQPFRQIDSGLARRDEGTGLGLAISRRLADLLGGSIRAESRQGVGSAFTFTLPLVRPA